MAAVSRLGYAGYGIRRAGSFAGKTIVVDLGQAELTPRLRPSRGPLQRHVRLFNFDLPLLESSGLFAVTEAPDIVAFVGDAVISATLAVTETTDIAAFTGDVIAAISGTLATTENPDTAAFAGSVAWTGTLATTEAPDIAAFAGNVAWTATLATTEAQDTAAFAGRAGWTGTLATTEAPDVAAFNGQAVISASLVTTEAQDIAYFVQVTGDPYWANVVLLMGFEGANGSTGAPGMTDESVAAHGTATVDDLGVISTAQPKFGGAAFRVPGGVGNGFGFADSADWQLAPTGSSPYTIEGWFYWNTTPVGTQCLVAQWANGHPTNEAWFWGCNTSTPSEMRWLTYADGTNPAVDVSTSGAGLASGSWYALAVDFDGTKIRLYVNGVMKGSVTPGNAAIFNSSETLTVGMDTSQALPSFDGWIDELRITKGVARYASDAGYLVPTAAFPRGPLGTTATLATTEAPDVAAFAGQAVISAVMATVEAADSAAFAGSVSWTGTLATTEAKDVMAFVGSAGWTATLAVTEATDVAAFAGQVRISAALATTEAQDVAAFNGFLIAPVTGTLAVTEAQDIANFAGLLVFTGIVGALDAVEHADTARFVVAQPAAVPGELHYGWPRATVRRRL